MQVLCPTRSVCKLHNHIWCRKLYAFSLSWHSPTSCCPCRACCVVQAFQPAWPVLETARLAQSSHGHKLTFVLLAAHLFKHIALPLNCCLPPAGMFSEAYIIFSLGLTKPLQQALFPACFKTHDACAEQLTHVQNYIQICGIIVGECCRGTAAWQGGWLSAHCAG